MSVFFSKLTLVHLLQNDLRVQKVSEAGGVKTHIFRLKENGSCFRSHENKKVTLCISKFQLHSVTFIYRFLMFYHLSIFSLQTFIDDYNQLHKIDNLSIYLWFSYGLQSVTFIYLSDCPRFSSI